MSSEASLVDQFIAITGSTKEQAQFYVESTDGQLDVAVAQYFDSAPHPTSSDVAGIYDEPPAPAVHDQLYGTHNSNKTSHTQPQRKRTRATGPPVVDDGVPVAQKAFDDTLVPDDLMHTALRNHTSLRRDPLVSYATQPTRSAAQTQMIWNDDRLSAMFRPPTHIMFSGSFDDALAYAERAERWLIVNIQSLGEFACHALNRDVWNNAEVQTMVQRSFVLWQQMDDSAASAQYKTYYNVNTYPHIAFIDPRTKQKIAEYMFDKSAKSNNKHFLQYCDQLISREGMPTSGNSYSATNGNGTVKTEFVDLTRIKSEEASAPRNFDDLNDEEQLKLAIAQSLSEDADDDDTIDQSMSTATDSVQLNSVADDSAPSHTQTPVTPAIEIPPEPAAGADVTRLQFRLDAKPVQRRFNKADTVQLLYAYVRSQLTNEQTTKQFVLITSQPRRQEYTDMQQTLLTAALLNASVVVEWI